MKYEIPLDQALFHEKIIRDLRSLVSGSLILIDSSAELLRSRIQYEVEKFIDHHPLRLLRMVERPEPRLPLGKWFERIFFAALRISFPFARVFHSVRDHHGGELDFVIIDGRNTIHIECSVKFFLYHPERGTGLASYVGPGGQDRLDLKFAKMRDVQLTRSLPVDMVQDGDLERVLWMSGRIHYPLNHQVFHRKELPQNLNPDHDRGYWGSRSEVFASLNAGESLLRVPRQWWLTSLDGLSLDWVSSFDSLETVGDAQEPFMTVKVAKDGSRIHEVDRGFVMPNLAP